MKILLFIIGILFVWTINAKSRVIDGKLLITKNYWRFEGYTIQHINNKGITIAYNNVFSKRRTTIKPQYWPDKLRNQISKRIYLDSKGNIYDIDLRTEKKDRLYKKGDYFFQKGTPVKNNKEAYVKTALNRYLINNVNDSNIEYDCYQKLMILILGEISKRNYTVELLSLPSRKQFKAYFNGKSIKQAEK